MFNWAHTQAHVIENNPMTGVSGRPKQKRRGEPVIVTEEGVRKIAALCFDVHYEPIATTFAAFIKVMYGTTARPIALRKLTGDGVDIHRRRVHLPAHKKAPPQDVAMMGLALEGFEMLPATLPSQHVFTNSYGGPIGKSTLNNWWSEVRAAYGRPEMELYDLRRSASTRLNKMGVRREFIAKQMTHTDNGEMASNHYIHEDREEAIEAILEADARATFTAPSPNSKQLSHIGGDAA
jgi:integrase